MPKVELTPEQMEQAQAFFESAKEAQHELWDTLFELEQILGFDVSATDDLEDTDLETLIADQDDEDDEDETDDELSDRCRECGEPGANGDDSYDGLCPSCADKEYGEDDDYLEGE